MNNQLDPDAFARSINRRTFLQRSTYGLGGLAFGALLGEAARADVSEPQLTCGSGRSLLTTAPGRRSSGCV